jgi:hypothetical protein
MGLMTRAAFRQADIKRAVKAVQALALTVIGVEIAGDGSIRVLTRDAGATEGPRDDLDDWRARRAARKAQGA